MNEMNTADREIAISRTIHAPRETVWLAFTRAESLDSWWGPNGFVTITHAFDFRVGGRWEFTMRGPDGTEYPNRIEYRAIEKLTRMEFEHSDGDRGTIRFQSSITLEDDEDGTVVTLRVVFDTAEERERKEREVGARKGGEQTLGRLALYIENK